MMKLAVLGCGNMATAILEGASQDKVIFDEVMTYTPSRVRAEALANKIQGRVIDSIEDAKAADIVLLGFKPQQFEGVAKELSPWISPEATVVSILAGTSMEQIQNGLGTNNIVRVMPNTPCQIRAGASLVVNGPGVSMDRRKVVRRLFESVSVIFEFDTEDELDRYTGVTGSGPAYLFEFSRQWESWLVGQGLDAKKASEMVRQSILGAALLQSAHKNISLEDLRSQVTSKNGVTFEALEVFKGAHLESTTHQALDAAYRRVKELAK